MKFSFLTELRAIERAAREGKLSKQSIKRAIDAGYLKGGWDDIRGLHKRADNLIKKFNINVVVSDFGKNGECSSAPDNTIYINEPETYPNNAAGMLHYLNNVNHEIDEVIRGRYHIKLAKKLPAKLAKYVDRANRDKSFIEKYNKLKDSVISRQERSNKAKNYVDQFSNDYLLGSGFHRHGVLASEFKRVNHFKNKFGVTPNPWPIRNTFELDTKNKQKLTHAIARTGRIMDDWSWMNRGEKTNHAKNALAAARYLKRLKTIESRRNQKK